ncbi:hypothetical protein CRENBAI_024762 [Crenichthys baileyi]|uniref:Glypican-1 n=1 Tax=Crenichthys baileyi TaxID=28760 RepID=A0AAV9SHU4_9TELE
MCPQGPTCCTSTMEENLAILSAQETEGLIREAGRSLQASFNSLHRSFDTYFTELHGRSERSLQEVLSSLGPLYSQNTRLFAELYTDLRQYYRGSALNLDENLSDFWSRLLERTFKASAPTDVTLSEDYFECVAKQQETLRPFGDIPRDMKTKVIRSFVTARSFVQGLLVSADVVKKVSQVSLAEECTKALMKLIYCPHCRGLASVKPCSNYCSNVMKGCLANQADLDPVWQELINTMIQVASSFSTEPSLDVVLSSIPVRIYQAVHYLQENMDTFTAKVFQTCGTPGEPGTGSPTTHEQKKKSGSLTAFEHKPSPTAGLRLEMQVSDLSSKLREMRQYWVQLPVALCSKLAAGSNSQDNCWNGITKASFLSKKNPQVGFFVAVFGRSYWGLVLLGFSSFKREFFLSTVATCLLSEDISGSGSGMCLSGQCARNRPGLYAYAPETNPVGGAAAVYISVFNLPLLLPFTILVLQR